MTSASEPLYSLVTALVDGTRSGSIRWKSADALGQAFIAKRSSGSVVVRNPSGLAVRLLVKDGNGETVEEVTSGSVGIGAFSVDSHLSTLWHEIQQQTQKADSTIRALADEFRADRG